MDRNEIKLEFPKCDQQCSVCLSIGRKLLPLGQYTNLFMIITSDLQIYQTSSLCNVMLCWECLTLLRKVSKFQQNVWRAYELLQFGQKCINGSLSTLTTIIYNDSPLNTVYIDETNIQTDKETVIINDNDYVDNIDINDFNDYIKDEDDSTNDYREMNIQASVIKEYNDSKVETNDFKDSIKLENDCVLKEEKETNDKKKKKKSSTRWAKSRVMQNKKPKFKLLSDFNMEDIFRNILIGNDEMDTTIMSERDREYKSSKWKCDRCIKGFNKESALNVHNNKIHSKNKAPFICDICNKRTETKRHLSTHIINHYYKYECTMCDYSTRKKSQQITHYQKRHRNIFQCLKCELRFGTRREFYKHFKKWHELFICDYCGLSFKMRYCIGEHIRKQHSPFECKLCDKRFARYNGLWKHNKTSHGPPSSSAYCVECDREYIDEYRYKWHLANSTRHRPKRVRRYPCPDCDKIFSKNIYMREHHNLVHLKHYKYRCDACDKNFLRNAALLVHKKRVHEGVLPPKNKICYMCGRGFSTNKILHNHIRTHTGERPFACAQCDARFTQSIALTSHLRAIHNSSKTKQSRK